MNAATFLSELRRREIQVWADGGSSWRSDRA